MKGANLLRRFAKECRAFAYDCAEEKAPIPIVGMFEDGRGGHCAVGWVLFRTDPGAISQFDTFCALSGALRERGMRTPCSEASRSVSPCRAVIDANNAAPATERRAAVVFPLLWMADELDRIAAMEPA